MRKQILCCVTVAVCLGMGAMAAPADAQTCGPLDNGRLADVRYEGTLLQFEPIVEYREMVLTITGPCEDIVRVFRKGEAISFDIQEIERVTDGHYTWQLSRVASIDSGVQEELQAARGTGKADDVWWSFFQKGLIPEGPYVDSGSFSVDRGLIIDPNSGEEKRAAVGAKSRAAAASASTVAGLTEVAGSGDNPLATKDFVINDDLIVQGSTCVGFDCVNGEVFSFDTIRLKENNLRIKFEDTSGGTFPTRDWEIEVNSSANGGQTHFRINDVDAARSPFTIEGNSPSHSLYVDSTGRVGLRTSTPVLDLHISTTNTPGMRLEQTSGGGFTAQTWDIAGNEANFFVRDVTGGSRLPLRIRPGAPTSSIDINDDGVGIQTTSADTELTVQSTATNSDVIKVRASGGTDQLFRVFEASTGEGVFSIFNASDGENIRLTGQGDGRVAIGCASGLAADLTLNAAGGGACGSGTESTINAGATQFTITSSRSIKKNLEPVPAQGILEKIAGIDVYTYDFINGPENRIGLMAEDFHTVFQRGSDKMLDGQEVEMALWLAVRELIAENQELSARLEALEESEPGPAQ